MRDHPLYSDPDLVRAVTRELLRNGKTIFQIFQLHPDEEKHSKEMLELTDLPTQARVLSLGSGVGGMEAIWKKLRPDLEFELVNASQEQIELNLCPGKTVVSDAEGYISPNRPFDCVLLAYVLGHVDVKPTLQSAYDNLGSGGILLIYDVFNSTPAFDKALAYQSPNFQDVGVFMKEHGMSYRHLIYQTVPGDFATRVIPIGLLKQTVPALFVLEKGEVSART